MSYAKNIEIYTSSTPTYFGKSASEKIGITNKKEYFIKNQNSPNLDSTHYLQGIGLVEGDLNHETINIYNSKASTILKLNKKYGHLNPRGKKINLKVEDGSQISSSVPFINVSSANNELFEISKWFKDRKLRMISSKDYRLTLGFTMDSRIREVDNDYYLDIIFTNQSDKDIFLTGIAKWRSQKDSKRDVPSVDLLIGRDFNVFKFNLNSRNLISKIDESGHLKVNADKQKIMSFRLNENDLSELREFAGKNDINLFYSISMNLELLSPLKISGKFNYNTNQHNFNF